MPDAEEDLKARLASLKESIIEVVRSRAKEFLRENAEAEKFLEDRAERLARLSLEYALAADEVARANIRADMEIVRQSMENELASLVLAASGKSRDLFRQVLGTVADVLVKALPHLIAAL